jgi:hypothetical protein
MSGYPGEFIAVAAGSLEVTEIHEFGDAVYRCPRRAEAEALGPHAHAA